MKKKRAKKKAKKKATLTVTKTTVRVNPKKRANAKRSSTKRKTSPTTKPKKAARKSRSTKATRPKVAKNKRRRKGFGKPLTGAEKLRSVVAGIRIAAGNRRVGATARAGKGYFKSSPEMRARTLMRLARGTPREKKAAVAIARLEAEHDGPPRKANGGSAGLSDEDARREYVDKHWGDKGRGGIRTARAADPAHGTLVKMGKVISIAYATKKRGDGFAHYEHEFEGPFPDLLFSDGGLVIAGGGYTVKRGGITG